MPTMAAGAATFHSLRWSVDRRCCCTATLTFTHRARWCHFPRQGIRLVTLRCGTTHCCEGQWPPASASF
eukprot:7082903-Prymnesium_polylepis.2